MKHVAEKVCDCDYCQMLDIMFGDPLLSAWEKGFVDSCSRQGWYKDYSSKQKWHIKLIFRRQKKIYATQKALNDTQNT